MQIYEKYFFHDVPRGCIEGCCCTAGIMMCRVLVGLGEGVAPGSATDMVARSCKQSERSRAIGFIFSGLHVGSLVGLLAAPVLIERLGWPAVNPQPRLALSLEKKDIVFAMSIQHPRC